ncbi:MAG: MFS transporter [Firmicutes bacterium]|nr:MFS transporter [Bacillota bacterium]
MNKLWTKNFIIITLGTLVSALGNAISAFSIALIVLRYTESTFLFAVFMVVYNLPKIVMPLIAGPYMDRFSRSKVIYTLDFLSAVLYFLIFVLLYNDLFLYGPFLFMAFIIGSIDSTYQLAYDSLYPTLVTEENYSKAYSISSMIYPLSSVMVLLAAFLYDNNGMRGLVWLFLFNAITFFVAAAFETQIRAPEAQIPIDGAKFSLATYHREFRDGLTYINGQKGLKIITAFFFLNMFAFAASAVVVLPYFMSTEALKTTWYTYVMAGGVIGRIIGGTLQYNIKYSARIRYGLSIGVYIALSFLEGSYLFFPALVMIGINLVSGILTVTSVNIRAAAMQSYVPNEYRGRFNGTFQMICTLGTILGQLLAGAMADFFGDRIVLAAFMGVNLIAVLGIMLPGKKHVSVIYNRAV